MSTPKTLYVLGSGPGIGRSVTILFATKRYTNIALISRTASQLKVDQKAIQDAVPHAKVTTYTADVADLAGLTKTLDAAEADLGKPECVFFNAGRVKPSELLTHDINDIELELKIQVLALYHVAQRYMPHLLQLAKVGDPSAQPALLVTSSLLPHYPVPEFFNLSLAKAAQRNLTQSLHETYGPEGVHIGVINVGGPVTDEQPTRNPSNIAARTWEWFDKTRDFEVVIL